VIAKGDGNPTVVFESGFAGGILLWRTVQDRVAERTREAASAWPLPPVPVLIFTAKKPFGSWPPKSDSDMAVWLREHDALASRIPGAARVTIDAANHLTLLTEPQLSDRILMLVERVRTIH
jgi:pimeloyl-ACP methyl ester carboxylesterase